MHRGFVKSVVPELLGFVCAITLLPAVFAQTKSRPSAEAQDDIIRVNTDLVQTDLMVFDKQGQFVDGLRGDQFALKIDNKPVAISFFERVTAGNVTVDQASISSSSPPPPAGKLPSTQKVSSAIVRGRTVIFFIDDLHLAPDSLVRTRKALLDFIDRGMADNDQVAITSSSGQIGFLQQFTTDRFALRSAVARLNYRANPNKQDTLQPPMSEYVAMKIRDGDSATIDYYVSEVMRHECYQSAPGAPYTCDISPQAIRHLVIERAQMIASQTAPDTFNTF